jgi:hypothetical protein
MAPCGVVAEDDQLARRHEQSMRVCRHWQAAFRSGVSWQGGQSLDHPLAAAYLSARRLSPVTGCSWRLRDDYLAAAKLADSGSADQNAVARRQRRHHAVPGHGNGHESLPQR